MVEWYDYWGLMNEETYIPYDFEILEIFFETYNMIIKGSFQLKQLLNSERGGANIKIKIDNWKLAWTTM